MPSFVLWGCFTIVATHWDAQLNFCKHDGQANRIAAQIAKKKAVYLPGGKLLAQNDDELLNTLMMAKLACPDFYLLVHSSNNATGLIASLMIGE